MRLFLIRLNLCYFQTFLSCKYKICILQIQNFFNSFNILQNKQWTYVGSKRISEILKKMRVCFFSVFNWILLYIKIRSGAIETILKMLCISFKHCGFIYLYKMWLIKKNFNILNLKWILENVFLTLKVYLF